MHESVGLRHLEQASTTPRVSIVIATRNRGSVIRDTLMSIQASSLQDWELVVVDQSAGDDTEAAVRPIAVQDPRIQYIRSPSTGASAGRNVALRMATAPYIAIIDDDCEAAPDWLTRIVDAFEGDPDVGFICGALIPAAFDPAAGHIPHSCPTERRIVTRPWPLMECYAANAAVRRNVLAEVGLFDESLGPGAVFSCTEDQDICHRVLLAGKHVLIDPDVRVIHHGFRTNTQMRSIWERDARGVGGMLAKEVRCGAPQALIELAGFWLHWLGIVLGRLIRLERPLKFRQARAYIVYSAASFVQGLRRPVARDKRVFTPQSWLSDDAATSPTAQLVLQGKSKW